MDSLESDGELLEQLETSEQLENLNQALKDVSVRNDMVSLNRSLFWELEYHGETVYRGIIKSRISTSIYLGVQ